ncbi:MAG: hypothetical protein M3442_10605 [Chloroflexota bacterium]|nr:hypothetical protein [Chloroflexota bacterium]
MATGEQLCGKWAFRELITEHLVDYLRIDLSHVGGVTETKKLASWAEAYYAETALHCTSGHIRDLASMHVDLSILNCGIQEFGGPTTSTDRAGRAGASVLEGGYVVEGGCLVPTGGPGLGGRVNVELLAALTPLAPSSMPRLRREDGAVTDW